MLEAKNLVKEYKTKNGPLVKALDDVSVNFEEKGMVFILGKSGSGKSTLLNVLGGLDKYDDGEVIVKGKSSKEFSQADFDSYRNTFIGFIFQDYNILEEFTVSKNIGLALELQGKKADKKTINDLIEQVDLKGLGNRKPNTLSGGQRQRVAIARALVKNPEIIMADEPTGALDSNTGKQVFDTLKKLSETKLVLIVSHDREFAEYYGDRIIELADGKIISDVQKYRTSPKENNGLEVVDDKIMTIKKGTKIDSTKAKTLVDFLADKNEDVIISVDTKANKEFRKFAKIDDEGNKESFKNTENLDIKEYDPKKFKLIRSKLPGKDSFKMGASGLKSKPIRLILTILLSGIAFSLFGLADTMGSYDKTETTIKSITDSKINYASISKERQVGNEEDTYYDSAQMSEDDFKKINSDLKNFNFYPVYSLTSGSTQEYFESNLFDTTDIRFYTKNLKGFMDINSENQANIGTLIGESRLPANDEEIVVTKYIYEVFKQKGYRAYGGSTKIEINNEASLIGKTINLRNKSFTIVGIIDTNMDDSRYERMKQTNFGSSLTDYMLGEEFDKLLETSYHALGYLNDGYFTRIQESKESKVFTEINTGSIVGYLRNVRPSMGDAENLTIYQVAEYKSEMGNDVYWLDGNSKENLKDNEVILSLNNITDSYSLTFSIGNTQFDKSELFDSNCANNMDTKLLEGYLNMYSNLQQYVGHISSILSYYEANNWQQVSTFITNVGDRDQIKGYLDEYFFAGGSEKYCVYDNVYKYFDSVEGKAAVDSAFALRSDEPWYSDINNYRFQLYNEVTNDYQSYFGNNSYAELTFNEKEIIKNIRKEVIKSISPLLISRVFLRYDRYSYDFDSIPEFNIVGYYIGEQPTGDDEYASKGIISNVLYDYYRVEFEGVYNFAVSSLDYNNSDLIKEVVNYTYSTDGKEIRYNFENPVMTTLEDVNGFIENMADVFLYVGIGFAVFASLLLLNFITISISYKKREIGVLRAIGARGVDVFRIFFNEAFIIAFINFILSLIGCVTVCIILNGVIRNQYGVLLTLLNVGIRQVILMFGVSVLVAFISSFLPVRSIARKKPIDAIRNA